ncbi:MAG: protein kinase, partial [Acidimicrobiales bacterium]
MDDVNSDSGPLQAAPSLPTALVDGRYRVRRRLAKGGMADVYLAEDTVLHRDVALKVLFSVYAADPTFVSRFRREATSAARLSHPNIVQVFDWASHDDTYYIAMEHVDGGSLADRLSDDRPLELDRLIEIGAATAAALGYAHDRGTVHRDVKPGNILITAAGLPKVADFGIASAAEGNDNLTETGTVLGTLNYMSPEQAAGERAGPASDLYSLGVVLFEMATGGVPFSAPTAVGLAHRLINEQAPRPSSIEPSIPAALDSLIVRLLAKEPTDRHLTAHQVEDALRAVAVEQRPMPPSP